MVVGVSRQVAGERDRSAIEELTPDRDGDQHRRVTVLGDTDDRSMWSTQFHHVLLTPWAA
jgi:hypothetical protein